MWDLIKGIVDTADDICENLEDLGVDTGVAGDIIDAVDDIIED
ncbi:hypothetical protein NVP1121O_214 [Vibrio phage 1.121.O._10N.286.46.C4]|nr:hypothetical protein NVP1121O_214 [Vibrio phage 1.121.O._10N.286.46.C4]